MMKVIYHSHTAAGVFIDESILETEMIIVIFVLTIHLRLQVHGLLIK